MNPLTFAEAYHQTFLDLDLDEQDNIPFLVWLFENPKSPISLPGKMALFDHDCLHVLLDLGISPAEEAFILGFAMGSDLHTNGLWVQVFKVVSQYFYPVKYRLSRQDIQVFDQGFAYGRSRPIKYLNFVNYEYWLTLGVELDLIRSVLSIDINAIQQMISPDKC